MHQKPTQPSERILVALDVPSAAPAETLVRGLSGKVGGFKVGLELFTASGAEFVQRLTQCGLFVFLDQKLHDIPNTVGRASRIAASLGIGMFTVHAAGGIEMMRQAVAAAREEATRLNQREPLVIAVTVLTSLSDQDLASEGMSCTVLELVRRRAILAKEAGLDGVVASPLEVSQLRSDCGDDFLIVVPGIRPLGVAQADQKRTMTPREALGFGADYLVIGRPIIAAPNPEQAALAIAREMQD